MSIELGGKKKRAKSAVMPLIAGAMGAWAVSGSYLMADTNYNGPDGGSWFTAGNWNGNAIPAAGATINIGDGAGLLAGDNSLGEGAVFDPATQTPGTLAYSYTDLYITHGQSSNTFENSSIASLDSGTMSVTTSITVGRFGNDSSTPTTSTIAPTGELIINGATLAGSANIDVANPGTVGSNQVAANGLLIFDSGTMTATGTLRVGETSAATATVINNGQGLGVITVGNFQPGAAANSNATLQINDGGGSSNNGVTLISVTGTTKIADVASNVAQSSATFNFDLLGAPVMTSNLDLTNTDLVPANIDLVNAATEQGFFTTVQGVSGLTSSSVPTVTASFGGNSYTWTLDYKAVVVGGVVTATTGGNDIVLLGQDSTVAVPEPASLGLLGLGSLLLVRRKRRAHSA